MTDKTIFTFDRPDDRQFTLDRLLPMLHRDDDVELNGESRSVRSATLVVDTGTGAVSLYVTLR